MSKTYKNKVIIDDEVVLKRRNDKLIELYDYLDSRGFSNHPEIIDVDSSYIKTRFIKKNKSFELIKGSEFIKTIASLHSSTIEYKDVSKNKYNKIYNKLLSNIEYLKEYYEKMISGIEEEIFMSPSHYLFARNYTILDSALKYSETNLKKWFNLIKNNSKERVCIVHNNLTLDHFVKGDKNYLLSFDNYLVDTPILDLYKFYRKEGYKLDFKSLMNVYEENFKLLEPERLLLNILISIPPKIEDVKDEFDNCINIKSSFDYIYSSMVNVS